jgi:predicted dehydrogenase
VTAYWEWPNQATGVFISSTGEAPGTNRLEITGTRGQLILEKEKLLFRRNAADMTEFSRTAQQGFAKLDFTEAEISFTNAVQPHALLMQNFVDAILDDAPLIAPGAEGIHSVELANAIVFSSLLCETLELPMNAMAWEKKLNQLAAESKFVKKTFKTASDDFAGSFKK